jgi:hypothetical protein
MKKIESHKKHKTFIKHFIINNFKTLYIVFLADFLKESHNFKTSNAL